MPTSQGLLTSHVPAGANVLLASGSYGAGHDAAAREIASRLTREHDCTVTTVDVATMFPARIGQLLRGVFVLQLTLIPGAWGGLLEAMRPGGWMERVAVAVLRLARPRLLAAASSHDVVICTHPFAAQALGPARARGLLSAHLLTYLTDMSVHAMWVAPGVDLHLATHEIPAGQARALGARTAVVAPLVPLAPEDFQGRPLFLERPYALVCGGSLGLGELTETALDLMSTGSVIPVVLCGRNARLLRRLSRVDGIIALSWRDDVATLMRHACCAVTNAGGFMTKEAVAAQTPVVSYRCIPGHGEANARAMEDAGDAVWARSPRELASHVTSLIVSSNAGPSQRTDDHSASDVCVPA